MVEVTMETLKMEKWKDKAVWHKIMEMSTLVFLKKERRMV